jgi:hypothetical protein
MADSAVRPLWAESVSWLRTTLGLSEPGFETFAVARYA